MKVTIASDHRGFESKKRLVQVLRNMGHDVIDCGCESTAACDYPDYAAVAAGMLRAGEAEVAILVDSSGIGMSICANKVPGVRAAVVHDEVMARVARDANHCNALCLGSDLLSQDLIMKIVEAFLATPYSDGRHIRRIGKIADLERKIW